MKHITSCFSNQMINLCQKAYASEKWKTVIADFLGAPLNKHIQLGTFKSGKLVLIVDCPLWASELKIRLPALREHIRCDHRVALNAIEHKIDPSFFKPL
jgi:hypothetical protein